MHHLFDQLLIVLEGLGVFQFRNVLPELAFRNGNSHPELCFCQSEILDPFFQCAYATLTFRLVNFGVFRRETSDVSFESDFDGFVVCTS